MYMQPNRQLLFSNIVKWPRKKVPYGCFTWLSYLLQKVNYFSQSFIESDSSFVGPICLLVNKIGTHSYHCQLPHYLRKTISSYIQLACKFFIDIRKTLFKLFQVYFLLNGYMWLTCGNFVFSSWSRVGVRTFCRFQKCQFLLKCFKQKSILSKFLAQESDSAHYSNSLDHWP